jgi:hypothetical protein
MALRLEAGFDINIVERVKKMEKTMRKIVLALLGVALIAGSTTQVAFAKSHHHVRHERQFTSGRFLNSNAAVMSAPERDAGGMGGWASMTGFN